MSKSSSSSTPNWEAEERKLQSVYDDIQNGRLNPALSTITRHLKKNPKSQPALIMKLVISQKLNTLPEDDLIKLYEEIRSKNVDSRGISGMTARSFWWLGLALRNIPRLDLALQLHQDLWATRPDLVELTEQVFLHAAAAWNLDVLVSSSRKLFNLTREVKWARAAAWAELMQKTPNLNPTIETPFPSHIDTANTLANANTLKTAQILISTTGRTSPTSDTLYLRIQILLAAGEYRSALDFARDEGGEGSLARLWWRMECVKVAIPSLKEEEREKEWEEEREWVEGLLKLDAEALRNYAFYKHLILATENSSPASYKKTDDFLCTLHQHLKTKERAPLLARLELQSRLRTKNNGQDAEVTIPQEKWLALVDEYWTVWGSKGSIITELVGIAKDDEERLEVILDLLKTKAHIPHTDLQTYKEQTHAEIIIIRQQKSIPSIEDAKRLWTLYLQGLDYGRNLPKTDVQPADQIGLVAINLLIVLWNENKKNLSLIYLSVACLQNMIERSPSNQHARFLLIKLYRLIGAPGLVAPHVEALKLSEIKLDTLLHVVIDRGTVESVLCDGQKGWNWGEYAKSARSMYKRSKADLPEYVKQAITEEAYSKIHGIRSLANSLEYSLSQMIINVEQARLALFTIGTIPESLLPSLKIASSTETKLVDNRNWELVTEIHDHDQDINGKKPLPLIKDIISLGGIEKGVGEKWINGFGKVLLILGQWLNGHSVSIEFDGISDEGLLASEAATLRAAIQLLREAERVTTTPSSTSTAKANGNGAGDGAKEGGAADESTIISQLFQPNLALIKSQHETRWESLQSIIALAELIKVSEIVHGRLVEISKTLKGKKRSPSLINLISDLDKNIKSVKVELGKAELDSVFENDEEGWKLPDGFIDEQDIIDNQDTIVNFQKQAIEHAKGLTNGKGGLGMGMGSKKK